MYFENFITEEFIDTRLLRDVFFRCMENRHFPEAEKDGGYLWKHRASTTSLNGDCFCCGCFRVERSAHTDPENPRIPDSKDQSLQDIILLSVVS